MDTENSPTALDVSESPAARPAPPRPAGHRAVAKTAALVAAGLLVGAGAVFAAVHRSGSSSNASAASQANGSIGNGSGRGLRGGLPGGAGVSGEQHVQGTLAAKTASTITVKSTGGTATYAVNATTEIVRNGQSATLADVKVGDPVFVHVYPSSSGQVLVERLFAGTFAADPGFGPPGTGTPTTSGTAPTTGSPA